MRKLGGSLREALGRSAFVPYSGITCIVAVPGTVVIPSGSAAGAGAGFAA